MQDGKKEFKAGQKWKTRSGDAIEISFVYDSEFYPVNATEGYTWNLDGSYLTGEENNLDLVELVKDVASEDKQDNKYSVEEVIAALYKISGNSFYSYIHDVQDHLSKTKDPAYQKYLELKAKFE